MKKLQKNRHRRTNLLVFMLKDLENVGMAGQVVKVKDGHAVNYLIPKGFSKKVNSKELTFLNSVSKTKVVKKEIIASKIGMLAEKIKTLVVTVKKRAHDDGKLYGSVGADDIVDALKAKEVSINKKQVDIEKAIRNIGEHSVVIKLSSKFQPTLTIKVVEDKAVALHPKKS